MFCPSCGFEYTQKTNYCKRCGESLGATVMSEAPRAPRPKIAPMFWAITTFGLVGLLASFIAYYNTRTGAISTAASLVGLLASFIAYYNLAHEGLRGDALIIPFAMGLTFTGAVVGLLVWQLSRMVSALHRTGPNVVVEKHYIREAPPAALGAPTDQIQQTVEPPSVVEHTTRQMAGVYREPRTRE
jgi:hypothetical protein